MKLSTPPWTWASFLIFSSLILENAETLLAGKSPAPPTHLPDDQRSWAW